MAPITRLELLERIALLVEEAVHGRDGETTLFHAANVDGEAFDLGLKPVTTGEHPVDLLDGFVAPPHWDIFGLVSRATSTNVDTGERTRVTMTFAAARNGEEVSVMRPDGGEPEVMFHLCTGAVADAVRMVLGLAPRGIDSAPPRRGRHARRRGSD